MQESYVVDRCRTLLSELDEVDDAVEKMKTRVGGPSQPSDIEMEAVENRMLALMDEVMQLEMLENAV